MGEGVGEGTGVGVAGITETAPGTGDQEATPAQSPGLGRLVRPVPSIFMICKTPVSSLTYESLVPSVDHSSPQESASAKTVLLLPSTSVMVILFSPIYDIWLPSGENLG